VVSDEQPRVPEELAAHCLIVARRLREGKVVPFLGAGANLCDRPSDVDWQRGFLPSGRELASFLAEGYGYPKEEPRDLLRVSQYVHAMTGGTTLYDELHRLFSGTYESNALHRLLAALPSAVRAWRSEGYAASNPLIVTTNWDDALENAFRKAEEPFDLITYVARGQHRGRFLHKPPEGEGAEQLIDQPNQYRALSLDKRTVILKIHGAVDRDDPHRDSYVITEDHYIEYLAQTDISNIIPASLMAAMNESHFLFLGYSLSDWNLRVILHRIWGQQPFEDKFTSWAIQKDPSPLEKRLWNKRNVEILDVEMRDYVEVLQRHCLGAATAETPA
jgi:SIR2-like domain